MSERGILKRCGVCSKEFCDLSPAHNRTTCSGDCRLEANRRIQNAWYAKNVAGGKRQRAPRDRSSRGGAERAFNAFGAKLPLMRRAVVIPTAAEEVAIGRKSTNDLTTEAVDAAARANERNKVCAGCGRKFFDETKAADQSFCGGKKCKRDDNERALSRPWASFDMVAGIPVVAVAR